MPYVTDRNNEHYKSEHWIAQVNSTFLASLLILINNHGLVSSSSGKRWSIYEDVLTYCISKFSVKTVLNCCMLMHIFFYTSLLQINQGQLTSMFNFESQDLEIIGDWVNINVALTSCSFHLKLGFWLDLFTKSLLAKQTLFSSYGKDYTTSNRRNTFCSVALRLPKNFSKLRNIQLLPILVPSQCLKAGNRTHLKSRSNSEYESYNILTNRHKR